MRVSQDVTYRAGIAYTSRTSDRGDQSAVERKARCDERTHSILVQSDAVYRRGSMGRKYQSIIETVGNTPVVRINRLAPQGMNLFVKIEAFNPLGSVKDRLALGCD